MDEEPHRPSKGKEAVAPLERAGGPLSGSANGALLKWRMFMVELRCTTLMTLNLILTDRSGGPLSRSERGAVLVNYGLANRNIICI